MPKHVNFITNPEFVDAPPPGKRGQGSNVWADRLAPVVANPGQWAVLAESPTNIGNGTQIKAGLGGFKRGDFDAVSRRCDDGIYRLYVKYVGTAVSLAA